MKLSIPDSYLFLTSTSMKTGSPNRHNSSPLISVLMPVYNHAETLDEAIESILNQTEGDFEFVIVDDGSSDFSRQKLQKWKQSDPRIRLLQEPHKGITSALNKGLEVVRGRYIARIDADDIAVTDRLEKQSQFLEQNPQIGVISGKVEYHGDRRKHSGYARYVDWINRIITEKEIALRRFVESPVPHPSVMFRSWIVKSLGGYRDGPFPEDYELWLRWLRAGIRFSKLDRSVLYWRDHSARLSRNHPRYKRMAFHRIKARYLSDWLRLYNPFHPNVVIWGSSRSNRKRSDLLKQYGIEIEAYIDINPNKTGKFIKDKPVWSPDELTSVGSYFVISFVSGLDAKEKIQAFLYEKGYREGIDYLLGA